MTKLLIIAGFLLAIFFTGHSIYYRGKTDKLLAQAIAQLPDQPKNGYDIFKPVNRFSNGVTLGRVKGAQARFLQALRTGCVQTLNVAPAPPEAFVQAMQALDVLEDIKKETGLETLAARDEIVAAARDAVPVLETQGTLSAWKAMIEFFDYAIGRNLVAFVLFDDFDRWHAQVRQVPLRPLGLRDALVESAEAIATALRHLGVAMTSEDGPLSVPIPLPLADEQLIQAENAFEQVQQAIHNFQSIFRETQAVPAELMGILVKTKYNMGAIKLAHLIDRGAALREMSSDYLFDLIYNPNSSAVPGSGELFGAFVGGMQGQLNEVRRMAPACTMMDPQTRDTLAVLACWNQAWAMNAVGQRGQEMQEPRAAAEAYAARVTGERQRAALQSMRNSATPLLIVEVP